MIKQQTIIFKAVMMTKSKIYQPIIREYNFNNNNNKNFNNRVAMLTMKGRKTINLITSKCNIRLMMMDKGRISISQSMRS